MRLKKIGTMALLAIMITSVFASSAVLADHTTADPTDADVYVDPSNVDEANDVYETIVDAENASADNDTISIAAGTYQEHVKVTTDNVSFVSHGQSDGDYVIIDGSNTTEGTALNVTASGVEFGDYLLTVNDDGSGGVSVGSGDSSSGSGFSLTDEYYGVPAFIWGIGIAVVGFVFYRESDE